MFDKMDKNSASFLIIERGPDKGKRIKLARFPVSIGRDAANDVVIKDDEISRNHLRIKQRGRIFVVEDLESRNGTYVNGDKVLNSILKNGDRLLVGSTELTFVTSSSQVQLAKEIIEFNMVVADELGIEGPIAVGESSGESEFAPLRINVQNLAHQITADSSAVKTLFDLHSNILVIDQLEEACSSFLKSVMKLMPFANRSALFLWSDSTRRLIPVAARHRQKRQKFLLSQRAFEDVLTRRQSVVLQARNPNVTQHGRARIVVPMLQESRFLSLLHIEVDDPLIQLPNRELELVLLFIQRCTPTFESMILRREMDNWMLGMVDTIISTIEANDTYTRGHSERVSKYSMAVADELKLNRETKRLLMISSLVHDVGKIGIPDNILKKAALLTAEEYEEMKLHPSIGADIVSHIPDAHRFLSGVKHHHEKWDGSGYPDGLVGEEIPFFARIVAIADVFDAMVSGRSYSGFIDQSDAIERLADEKDIFDPEVTKAFIRAYESGSITLKTSTQNNLPQAPDQAEPPPESDDTDND
jgi:HD-GYP domain-containing protein (c-di-GMP phosphodiesterase class II)